MKDRRSTILDGNREPTWILIVHLRPGMLRHLPSSLRRTGSSREGASIEKTVTKGNRKAK